MVKNKQKHIYYYVYQLTGFPTLIPKTMTRIKL